MSFWFNTLPKHTHEHCCSRYPSQVWHAVVQILGGQTSRVSTIRHVILHHICFWTTKEAIEKIYSSYKYIACPHTAIAWQALKDWQQDQPTGRSTGVFLSTAHPCKFPGVLPEHIAKAIEIPEEVKKLDGKTKHATALGMEFAEFKRYLLENK